MDIITFTQTRGTENIFIYPNGNLAGCINWTPFGEAQNWACVDEDKNSSDEDTTYVWHADPSTVTDLYTLPNQVDLGAINYVQIYARAKSHNLPQDPTSIFHIILSHRSVCTDLTIGMNRELTTVYQTFADIYTLNPGDDNAWEWTDIDILAIGVLGSSVTYQSGEQIELLMVDGNDAVELSPSNPIDNWECIWFETTYCYPPSNGHAYKEDTYTLDDNTTDETGTITRVVVSAYVRSAEGDGLLKLVLDSNGTKVYGTEHSTTLGYAWYSHEWALDPDTVGAWSWAAIDALIAGITVQCNGEYYTRVMQLRVSVYYTSNVNPEIHATQCYAKVNYDAAPVECSLNNPETVSSDHARNVKMLNFWSGDREVYDLSRSNKTVVITGSEFHHSTCSGTTPCDRILCIRGMGVNGTKVNMTGLYGMYDLLNGEYNIRSFGWKKISHNPINFDWILELEAAVE